MSAVVNSTPQLMRYEHYFMEQGYAAICGVDEAGRGPLAGPVVAAAVIFPKTPPNGIADSKKLSEKKRLQLLPVIMTEAEVGIGIASEAEIDQLNILKATFLAMRRAVEALPRQPDLALVDGNADPHLGLPTRAIVGGDAKSASIGAASIVAKCTRDQLMREAHELYPQYNFAQHKGYPTKAHYAAIETHGLCPIHRRSFFKNKKKGSKAPDSGRQGEDFAAQTLIEQGYTILARNYRGAGGEIDLIATKDTHLCFVEVKTRALGHLVSPGQAVDTKKQQLIIQAAAHYIQQHPSHLQPRFDAFLILTERASRFKVAEYQYLKGAFEAYETHRHD